jgi:hypothetical protein
MKQPRRIWSRCQCRKLPPTCHGKELTKRCRGGACTSATQIRLWWRWGPPLRLHLRLDPGHLTFHLRLLVFGMRGGVRRGYQMGGRGAGVWSPAVGEKKESSGDESEAERRHFLFSFIPRRWRGRLVAFHCVIKSLPVGSSFAYHTSVKKLFECLLYNLNDFESILFAKNDWLSLCILVDWYFRKMIYRPSSERGSWATLFPVI